MSTEYNDQSKPTGSRLPFNRLPRLHSADETTDQRAERLKNELNEIRNEQQREYYDLNSKKIKTYMKKYRKAQKENVQSKDKKYL